MEDLAFSMKDNLVVKFRKEVQKGSSFAARSIESRKKGELEQANRELEAAEKSEAWAHVFFLDYEIACFFSGQEKDSRLDLWVDSLSIFLAQARRPVICF